MTKPSRDFLNGKFLIAMPAMQDPRFEHSVVYIVDHSETGAMGIIINKPMGKPDFADLCDHLDIPRGDNIQIDVVYGGPVEQKRGFVIHTADYVPDRAGRMLSDGLAMSTTMNVVHELAMGKGPKQALVAIGFSGWGEGQLEGEIARNDWLIGDVDPNLIFSHDFAHKWRDALINSGIDPRLLSSTAGRA